jgi:ketosteroid isomerase-like protein
MAPTKPARYWLLFLALFSPFGFHAATIWGAATTSGEEKSLADTLKDIVHQQQVAWNDGNIDGFMEAYWKSEKLTFSSRGETRRGWEKTRQKYKQSYPDNATMGMLTFSNLEVEPIGEEAAIMLGDWKITGDKPAEGNFSLVWKRIDGKWVIVHDHSSSREKK